MVTQTKLQKIQALAERGVGGEKENARHILQRLSSKPWEPNRSQEPGAPMFSPARGSVFQVAFHNEQKHTLDSLLWYVVNEGRASVYSSKEEPNTYYLIAAGGDHSLADLVQQFECNFCVDLCERYGYNGAINHPLYAKSLRIMPTGYNVVRDVPLKLFRVLFE